MSAFLTSVIGLLTASLGALAAFWTARTAFLQYLERRRYLERRPTGPPPRRPAPPPPPAVPPHWLGLGARLSVYSGVAAWLFALVMVIHFGYMVLSLSWMPLVALTAAILLLVIVAAVFGILVLWPTWPYPGNSLALRAGSGTIFALFAAIAMLIITT